MKLSDLLVQTSSLSGSKPVSTDDKNGALPLFHVGPRPWFVSSNPWSCQVHAAAPKLDFLPVHRFKFLIFKSTKCLIWDLWVHASFQVLESLSPLTGHFLLEKWYKHSECLTLTFGGFLLQVSLYFNLEIKQKTSVVEGLKRYSYNVHFDEWILVDLCLFCCWKIKERTNKSYKTTVTVIILGFNRKILTQCWQRKKSQQSQFCNFMFELLEMFLS